jgi:hypothetical protein
MRKIANFIFCFYRLLLDTTTDNETDSGDSRPKFESDNSDSDLQPSSGYLSTGNPSNISNEELNEDEEVIIERINDQQVTISNKLFNFGPSQIMNFSNYISKKILIKNL